MGLSRRCWSRSGWPMMASGAPCSVRNRPSMAASVTGWWQAMFLPCPSPVGNSIRNGGDHSGDHAEPHEGAAVRFVAPREQIERAHRGHHETGGDHRSGHVVQVLPEGPGVQQQFPETGQQDLALAANRIADRMLHPGIGGDDEEAGKPGSGEYQEARRTSAPWVRGAFRRREIRRENWIPERTKTLPPWRAFARLRHRRFSKSAPSWCRTGTPWGCP